MTVDLSTWTVRQLQTESARVLASIKFNNNELVQFNKLAHHDSQQWYRAVILWYVSQYTDIPSKAGPGASVTLLMQD